MKTTSHFIGISVKSDIFFNIFVKIYEYFKNNNIENIFYDVLNYFYRNDEKFIWYFTTKTQVDLSEINNFFQDKYKQNSIFENTLDFTPYINFGKILDIKIFEKHR